MANNSLANSKVLKLKVVPDRVDLRDREYQPSVNIVPKPKLEPEPSSIPVLNQRETNACTGFALASVVYHLQHSAGRDPKLWEVSPFMLYSMARRYDEFPGDPEADTGSSIRGALKGWYKHGVCANRLWKDSEEMPSGPVTDPKDDWWMDAMQRPLGAYYRIDTRSVTDMQIALNGVGILYASAACHKGWFDGFSADINAQKEWWTIPRQKAELSDGGHAFAIVGYNIEGFIIHNSWDEKWGTAGRALLTYDDWLDNAMDCWVAQLGVVTEQHLELAKSQSFQMSGANKVLLSADRVLRTRQIMPFIIDMGNNGELSNTGDFRTQDSDIEALINWHLPEACKSWGLDQDMPVDIAIFAHGGLVSEGSARPTAERWIPALYEQKIFPIFLMWETGPISALINIAEEIFKGQPRLTGSWFDEAGRWWNERLEKLLSFPGTKVWDEMKENANAVSGTKTSGGIKLLNVYKKSEFLSSRKDVRLHLIGHSAGAILHSYIVDRWVKMGQVFKSVNFMAPAARIDLFEKLVLPSIQNGTVERYNQFHLSDEMEQKDPTCKPLAGYSRSLLYFVSQSLEKGEITPLLGLQKYFDKQIASQKISNIHYWSAPSKESNSVTHGGFNQDETTIDNVITLIRKGTL